MGIRKPKYAEVSWQESKVSYTRNYATNNEHSVYLFTNMLYTFSPNQTVVLNIYRVYSCICLMHTSNRLSIAFSVVLQILNSHSFRKQHGSWNSYADSSTINLEPIPQPAQPHGWRSMLKIALRQGSKPKSGESEGNPGASLQLS